MIYYFPDTTVEEIPYSHPNPSYNPTAVALCKTTETMINSDSIVHKQLYNHYTYAGHV